MKGSEPCFFFVFFFEGKNEPEVSVDGNANTDDRGPFPAPDLASNESVDDVEYQHDHETKGDLILSFLWISFLLNRQEKRRRRRGGDLGGGDDITAFDFGIRLFGSLFSDA